MASWVAGVIFVLLLVSGAVLVVTNSHSLDTSDSRTTVEVRKGPGAYRRITRTTGPEATAPRADGAKGGTQTLETKIEAPRGAFAQGKGTLARAKTTSEHHPRSFLESLVGDQGPVVLQLAAVLLAAFVGAAIFHRVLLGNFRFKIGPIDLSGPEEAAVRSASFDLELRTSLESMAGRMEELEEFLATTGRPDSARAWSLSKPDVPIPSDEPYVKDLARILSRGRAQSGLPPKDPEAFEVAIEEQADVLVAEGADTASPREQPKVRQHTGKGEAEGEGRPDTEDIVEAMEGLLADAREMPYRWRSSHDVPITATIARSEQTYDGIRLLLHSGRSAQAAVLTGSLYEEMVVAHWLFSKRANQELLADWYQRHRRAIASRQKGVAQWTDFSIPFDLAESLDPYYEARVVGESGAEETREWTPWAEAPGQSPEAEIRETARKLERLATDEVMFFPRLAGGEGALFPRLDHLIHDWLNQAARPTAIGSPFAPPGETAGEMPGDQTPLIGFAASWLFAQQTYLRFDLDKEHDEFDAGRYEAFNSTWLAFLEQFAALVIAPEETEELLEQWRAHYSSQPGESRTSDQDS